MNASWNQSVWFSPGKTGSTCPLDVTTHLAYPIHIPCTYLEESIPQKRTQTHAHVHQRIYAACAERLKGVDAFTQARTPPPRFTFPYATASE